MRFLISISLSFIISNTNLVASEKLFPNYITDVDGNELSFSSLAENKTVCLITLKSINCPICLEQLKRLTQGGIPRALPVGLLLHKLFHTSS